MLATSLTQTSTPALGLPPVCSPFPSSSPMRHQKKPESRRRQDGREKQTSVHSVAIILKTQAAPCFLLQTSASSEATSHPRFPGQRARAKARKPTQVCEPGTPQKTQAHTLNCQFSPENHRAEAAGPQGSRVHCLPRHP